MQQTAIQLILNAAIFAERKHRGQTRKGRNASPYITHPLELARILVEEGGVEDPQVIAAALLHDTIEDTKTTPDELRIAFSARVASVVLEVTDDKALPKQMRKRLQVVHSPRLSRHAKLVKLADKIANLRDIVSEPPETWGVRRKLTYVDWARQVVDGLRGTNAALEARFDEIHREGIRRFGRKLTSRTGRPRKSDGATARPV